LLNLIYLDLLKAQAKGVGGKRNAQHTRLKLKISAAEILEENGYDGTSIALICKKSGLTRAGFYIYYKNKEELIIDLLKGLLATEQQLIPSLTDCENIYQAIESICTWYLSFQIGSAAMFFTLNEVHRYIPEVDVMRKSRRTSLLKNLTYQLERFDKFREVDPRWRNFVLEMVGQGIHNMAQERAAHKGQNKGNFIYDVDEAVKLFSRMQYQALFCEPVQENKI